MNTYYQFSAADTAAGSVSLILTSTNNGTCLPVSDTMNIIFGNTSFVYAGPDQTVCGGMNLVNLNGFVTGGSTTGQWVTLGSGSFFPFDTLLNAIYVVSAADSINGFVNLVLISTYNGTCNAGSDTMTIFIDRVPIVNAGNNLSECYGNTSQLNGTVAFAAGGVWTTSGTGTFVPNANTLTAQYIPSFGDSIAGTVTLILTSTGSITCNSTSDTMLITYMKPLIPDFIVSVACENHAASFNDITTILSGSISNWLWDFGGGNLANTQNASFVFSTLGSHLVTLTVTSNLGCSFSITKTIVVNPSPVVSFSSMMTCAYQNVNFTDGSTISSGSITNWDWTFGDGYIDSVPNPVHNYNKDTIFSVTLIITSDAGCVDSVSNNITFYPSPIANFTNAVECANVPILFTDFSTISGGFINSWNWDFGSGATSGIQNPTTLYPTGGNYNVTLIVQSDHGCKDTIIKPIDVFTGPTAGFSVSGDLITGNTLTFTNTSSGSTASNWDFGDGVGTSTIQNPMYTYSTEGNYSVTLIVWDEHGCPDTATTDLFIVLSITNELFPPKVPTGFSPNSDGQNDTLYVRGGPFSFLEFKIFNSWGQEIFSSNDASVGWDGTWKNFIQPVGVYTWTVKATTMDGIEYKKSGNVTLIR
jgi:gliding motility-associated-like protein